jgi:ubiquinone biosynthesis monooxygenase Coq7
VHHLEDHLKRLPEQDKKSEAVLKQMQRDEAKHRDAAMDAGAAELPGFIQKLMRCTSKVMVKVAYSVSLIGN